MSRKKAPARKRTGAFRVKSPGRLHECPSVPAGSKACMPEKETPPRMPLSGKKATYESPGLSRAERTLKPYGKGTCTESAAKSAPPPKKNRSVHLKQRKNAGYSANNACRSIAVPPARARAEHRGPRRQQGRPRPAASERPCKAPPEKAARTFCRHERRLRPHGRQGSAEILSGGRHSPAAFIRKTRSPGRVRFFWKNKEPCPPAPSAHPASSFPPGSGRPRPR